jgi:hypothetical protein
MLSMTRVGIGMIMDWVGTNFMVRPVPSIKSHIRSAWLIHPSLKIPVCLAYGLIFSGLARQGPSCSAVFYNQLRNIFFFSILDYEFEKNLNIKVIDFIVTNL